MGLSLLNLLDGIGNSGNFRNYCPGEKKRKKYKLRKNIFRLIRNSFIFSFALFLAILFPQYQQPQITGNNEIEKAKYTWIDPDRLDEFSNSGENRALTVEFCYPKNTDKTYPLVVFSHGAFGFSGSNHSTFAELASNGYVVASIGHTHQAFYTSDTSGKVTIVNNDFINRATQINAMAVSLGISILVIDLAVNLILWVNDQKTARIFNQALKKLQKDLEKE